MSIPGRRTALPCPVHSGCRWPERGQGSRAVRRGDGRRVCILKPHPRRPCGPADHAADDRGSVDLRHAAVHQKSQTPAGPLPARVSAIRFGRAAGIRTRDLLNPIQARYQAALQPVALMIADVPGARQAASMGGRPLERRAAGAGRPTSTRSAGLHDPNARASRRPRLSEARGQPPPPPIDVPCQPCVQSTTIIQAAQAR